MSAIVAQQLALVDDEKKRLKAAAMRVASTVCRDYIVECLEKEL